MAPPLTVQERYGRGKVFAYDPVMAFKKMLKPNFSVWHNNCKYILIRYFLTNVYVEN